jgi:T-complex protein 1 subunit eta
MVSGFFLLYRDMFCAGRVPEEDLRRTMKACGGSVMTTAHDVNDSVLGRCDYFEERQIGGERYSVVNHVCIADL